MATFEFQLQLIHNENEKYGKYMAIHDIEIINLEGVYGKPTAHAHVIMFNPLPVGRMPCRVRSNGVVRGHLSL